MLSTGVPPLAYVIKRASGQDAERATCIYENRVTGEKTIGHLAGPERNSCCGAFVQGLRG
ncbi:hypothetical protein LptCag_2598 [Leptospirillum ferriphilum]|uniref:Uncharacterized protein n=1 Tax=Leptospirillum ferriphilum TaxID=178606 RepID=A0A094X9E8_9BACT|nr:hypothetical protein LptCag_2598 [Leptospirillum ferriphilum]